MTSSAGAARPVPRHGLLVAVAAMVAACSTATPAAVTQVEPEPPVVELSGCGDDDCAPATTDDDRAVDTPIEEEPHAQRTDGDGDGVPDEDDECPAEPEDRDGFEDEDGCPEATGNPARDAFELGMEAYQSGDYGAARRHFEEAYRLDPRDVLLFNLAQAALKQGDPSGACRYHRRWKATPSGLSGPSIQALAATCP